jgi:uncharacterized protein
MIILLSPAKNIKTPIARLPITSTQTRFDKQSSELLEIVQDQSPQDLMKLMKISEKLGILNYERFQELDFPIQDGMTAAYAFNGDVYQELKAIEWNATQFDFAQSHLRILSGFYGLLKPADQILPYRLEMGTKFLNNKGKNLYEFWGSDLSKSITRDATLTNSSQIVNLASNEYSHAINPKDVPKEWINIQFRQSKDGQLKNMGMFAKRARGMMARFAILNKFTDASELKTFNESEYNYSSDLSTNSEWFFVKEVTK